MTPKGSVCSCIAAAEKDTDENESDSTDTGGSVGPDLEDWILKVVRTAEPAYNGTNDDAERDKETKKVKGLNDTILPGSKCESGVQEEVGWQHSNAEYSRHSSHGNTQCQIGIEERTPQVRVGATG
mmetsp:Transcript_1899/g.2570  ORF Transcript_1899/g.2570 Transcript_1899/m.2570 type:complete len:126 (+) Transcript_1899:1134-1511(+)